MPSHQFNHFTGRLRESKHFQPLYPISPSPLQSAEPPKMIYAAASPKQATAPNTRSIFHQSARDGTLPKAMREKMIAYQRDLEAPVYLLRGTPDKIFFGFTCTLIGVGLAMMYSYYFQRAFPRKSQ